MIKSNFFPRSISIMRGSPDVLSLQNTLSLYDFSETLIQPRPKILKNEKPQDFLNRFFKDLSINSWGHAFTVACGQRILDIPSNPDEAKKMISLLSGRRHQLWLSFGIKFPEKLKVKNLMTRVSFKNLTEKEIDDYIASEAWRDVSGGYSFKDPQSSRFIKSINGSPGLLSGMPFYEFYYFMQSQGQFEYA